MKIICIGRNYAAHAAELNNPIPEKPLIFLKPDTALLKDDKPFYIPDFSNDIHYELELVVRISKSGKSIQTKFASQYYQQITVGIDFTARDLQSDLKSKGHPWEISKAFDYSALLGSFVSVDEAKDKDGNFQFYMEKNKEKVQVGNSSQMLTSIDNMISYVSHFFTLHTGDLLFTGTPAGVGPVKRGDLLEGYLKGEKRFICQVK